MSILSDYISAIRSTHELSTTVYHQSTLNRFTEECLSAIYDNMFVLCCKISHTTARHDAIVVGNQYGILICSLYVQRIPLLVDVVEFYFHTLLLQRLANRVTLIYRNPNTLATGNAERMPYRHTSRVQSSYICLLLVEFSSLRKLQLQERSNLHFYLAIILYSSIAFSNIINALCKSSLQSTYASRTWFLPNSGLV